ncbi:MAG: hypothetical protein ACRERV_07940 [Methylococcales bacterium]
MMRKLKAYLAAAILMTGIGGQALAKNICAIDNVGNKYVFKNVTPLTEPGDAFPLIGYLIVGDGTVGFPFTSFPFSGSAMVQADRTVLVGLSIHGNIPISGNSLGAALSIEAKGPKLNKATKATLIQWAALAPPAQNIGTGDFTWSPLKCNLVVLP